MGGISSKNSVRFERRNSRRQSQRDAFHQILNQTKDISNKLNTSKAPLTRQEYTEFKNTLENATRRLNNLAGALKSKNANSYKQACQFVNDTFVYLETKVPKDGNESMSSVPASPNQDLNRIRPDSITSQATLTKVIIKSDLPNIQEEPTVKHQASQENLKQDRLTPMEEIQTIRKHVNELNKQIKVFDGVKYDEEYTSIVCALDEDEVALQDIKSFGDEIIRQEKKNVYIFIQQCLNTLETKCGKLKAYPSDSEEERKVPKPPAKDYDAKDGTSGTGGTGNRSSSEEESYINTVLPTTPGATSSAPQNTFQRKIVITQV